ncbi:hypothetical protein SteCoe_14719 [Stentor coeruleus]|uniref:Protein kinase domain-containing protein n=1 Tax=Stentor coeruleus TaxID=5963 RepID=A0A1R2C5H6_9CILI|nr:hypothetical protein SteCoe_14719 [Stentor coeruleus]
MTKIQNYELLDVIGYGKYSIVYKARRDNAIYAMKVIELKKANDINICRNEADILKKLKSQFVINHIEDFTLGNIFYIVTEFYEQNLKNYLRMNRNTLSIEEKQIIVLKLCKALKFIHSESIIHRDIKPENIFINNIHEIKFGDFGLAKIIGQKMGKAGTFLFMAPEVLLRQPYCLPADIWSLGVTIYYILYDSYPFNSPFPKEILEEHKQDIEFLKEKGKIGEIIQKIFCFEANKRPKIGDILKIIKEIFIVPKEAKVNNDNMNSYNESKPTRIYESTHFSKSHIILQSLSLNINPELKKNYKSNDNSAILCQNSFYINYNDSKNDAKLEVKSSTDSRNKINNDSNIMSSQKASYVKN